MSQRFALRSMRWGGTMARPWSLPAPSLRWRAIPTASSVFRQPTHGRAAVWRSIRSCRPVSRLIHADIAVRMEDKPSQALRYGRRKSSMWLAIDAVKKKEADTVVSAGNTGALMAMSKFGLKMLPGIERPAIAALWPTCAVNRSCLTSALRSVRMRSIWSISRSWAPPRRAFCSGIKRPTVGLLNIGVEEVKGLEEVAEAGRILRERQMPDLDYVGLCRRRRHRHRQGGCGRHRRICRQHRAQDRGGHRPAVRRTPAGGDACSLAAASAICWRAPLFAKLREKHRPRRSNGGVLLGLNGIVIKSHGGTDAEGFAAAIELGLRGGYARLLAKITAALGGAGRRRRGGLIGAAS